MASNFTGIALAEADNGQYKKSRFFFRNTAGVDLSNGGIFVTMSGEGVIAAPGSADVAGILLDPVASAGSAYVDVYNGIGDKFTAVLISAAATSAVNNSPVYAFGTVGYIANEATGLDIVGILCDNITAITEGNRATFALTPSQAIPGYDSGDTA